MGAYSLDGSAHFVPGRGGWESPSELKEVVTELARAHGVDMAVLFLLLRLKVLAFASVRWFSTLEGFFIIKLDLGHRFSYLCLLFGGCLLALCIAPCIF